MTLPAEVDEHPECACRHFECYSDEHYVPTLLASRGLENQTDCAGGLTNVDW